MIDPGPDASAWVEPDRTGSFRFVCAGAAADTGLLEHAVPGGRRGLQGLAS